MVAGGAQPGTMLERWFAFAVLLGALFALAQLVNEEPAGPPPAPEPPLPDAPRADEEPAAADADEKKADKTDARAPKPEPPRRGLLGDLLAPPRSA